MLHGMKIIYTGDILNAGWVGKITDTSLGKNCISVEITPDDGSKAVIVSMHYINNCDYSRYYTEAHYEDRGRPVMHVGGGKWPE